jgi:hypothetical protein
MKNSLFAAMLLSMFLFSSVSFGQNIQKDANGNYSVVKKEKTTKEKKPDVKTGQTFTDSRGNVWPIYRGARGGLYALITSASGNVRKQYLKQQ